MKRLALVLATATVLAYGSVALAGPVGGPGSARGWAPAYSSVWFNESFYGGELAVVSIVGSGVTDLDLFIYDEFGNLIAYDINLIDRATVTFRPVWTGRFRIEVRNLGPVGNPFTLWTR